jgi:hypothetical protein
MECSIVTARIFMFAIHVIYVMYDTEKGRERRIESKRLTLLEATLTEFWFF